MCTTVVQVKCYNSCSCDFLATPQRGLSPKYHTLVDNHMSSYFHSCHSQKYCCCSTVCSAIVPRLGHHHDGSTNKSLKQHCEKKAGMMHGTAAALRMLCAHCVCGPESRQCTCLGLGAIGWHSSPFINRLHCCQTVSAVSSVDSCICNPHSSTGVAAAAAAVLHLQQEKPKSRASGCSRSPALLCPTAASGICCQAALLGTLQ
jgi:hypothetical protein